MKSHPNKLQAKEAIALFFQKATWKPEELRKLKRHAMRHRIRLKDYKKRFCKYCLNPLKGTIRITKTHKTIECKHCGLRNKIRIS